LVVEAVIRERDREGGRDDDEVLLLLSNLDVNDEESPEKTDKPCIFKLKYIVYKYKTC
jgi:hypothetical protein